MRKRPFEMSGGQLQRSGFATALACKPRVVLADEPVSMFDVSIWIGILNLMRRLREEQGLSFLYVIHDIASACYVSDRIVVMYGGHVVETARVEELARAPEAPVHGAAAQRRAGPAYSRHGQARRVPVDPPHVIDPGEGCRFRDRCPLAIDRCSEVTPRPRRMGAGHEAACHVAEPEPAPAIGADSPIVS